MNGETVNSTLVDTLGTIDKGMTCKICKREKLETLYFVCPDCIEDVRRNHVRKKRGAK